MYDIRLEHGFEAPNQRSKSLTMVRVGSRKQLSCDPLRYWQPLPSHFLVGISHMLVGPDDAQITVASHAWITSLTIGNPRFNNTVLQMLRGLIASLRGSALQPGYVHSDGRPPFPILLKKRACQILMVRKPDLGSRKRIPLILHCRMRKRSLNVICNQSQSNHRRRRLFSGSSTFERSLLSQQRPD